MLKEIESVINIIGKNKGILLVEQNIKTALAAAKDGYTIEKG